LIIPKSGWAEQDPEWYWKGVTETIRVSIQKAGINPKDIIAVGLSSLTPACILIDKDFKPLQNSHIWMDRRATNECEWIRKIWDKEILREIGIDEGKLPPVYPCDDIVGKVTEKGSTVYRIKGRNSCGYWLCRCQRSLSFHRSNR